MAATKIPNSKPKDFYVPEIELKVGGKMFKGDRREDIIDVFYQDHVRGFDTFSFTLRNWDDEKRAFKYSDDDLLNPRQTVELVMRYRSQTPLTHMIKGKITWVDVEFPSSGVRG